MAGTVESLEIEYREPLAVFTGLGPEPGSVFLDSALPSPRLGRHAFIGLDPFQTLFSKDGQVRLAGRVLEADPFAVLARELARFPLARDRTLPPFQTGAIGYFGYDLCHHLERLPAPRLDDMAFPDLAIGFYDLALAFDLEARRAWILASGHPATEPGERRLRARRRLAALRERLSDLPQTAPAPPAGPFEIAIASNFAPAAYRAAVARVIAYIYAGDIFQANLSQRFTAKIAGTLSPFELYLRLRAFNPAPFAAYLDFGEVAIASASPERFLLLQDDRVETRPMKGTRPRGFVPEEDAWQGKALRVSEKDQAENVMIVDLLRNDLSRICRDHSVQVPEICVLESFATVHHLVSTVTGRLRPGAGAVDLLRATFPGGSITGAPKIRAMEVIAELEPTRRGPYCGAIGYVGFDGSMDTSITIRTFAIKDGTATFQTGGGIVADSRPAAEYEETLDKAKALIRALRDAP